VSQDCVIPVIPKGYQKSWKWSDLPFFLFVGSSAYPAWRDRGIQALWRLGETVRIRTPGH